MIESREFYVKSYLEEQFVPFLNELFKRSAPLKYEMYQGNFCRQAAIYGVILLEDLLPDYEWEAWEAHFKDIVQGKHVEYEHAWIYGKKKRSKRKLLIDLSRNHHERLFVPVTKNRYPDNHPAYKNMKEIKKKRIPIEQHMQDYEFYTGLQAEVIIQTFKEESNFQEFISGLRIFELMEKEPLSLNAD